MKKIFCFSVVLFLIFLSFSFSGEIVDRILAVVEDEVILLSEVEMLAQMYAVQLKIDPGTDPEKYNDIRQYAMEQMIEQYVLLAKAIEDSVEITDEEVDMVLDQQIKDMIQQYGSQEEAVKQLGMPIRKVKQLYREEVRKKGLVDRYKQQLSEKVKITGEEIEEFYGTYKDSLQEIPDRYLISQILKTRAPGDNARDAATEKAQMILQKIRDGAGFYEMAQQYSDDEVTKTQGGLLGFIRRGDLIKSFEDVAFSLEVDEVSDVVETPFGLHIMKVLEKRDDAVNLQHILIKIVQSESDEERTVEFLRELKKRIENGESFEEMAKEYSDDPEVGRSGGKIGWIYLESIQNELEIFVKILPSMKIGEISEPFKTKFGYHIVLLEDKEEKHNMTLEKDRDTIEEFARRKKGVDEFARFVERAKKEVYVEIKESLP